MLLRKCPHASPTLPLVVTAPPSPDTPAHDHMINLTGEWTDVAENNLLKVIKLAKSVTFPLDQSRGSEQQCQCPCQWQSTETWQVRKWALWGSGDTSTAVPAETFVDPPLGLHGDGTKSWKIQKRTRNTKEGKLWMSMQTQLKAVTLGNSNFQQLSKNYLFCLNSVKLVPE